jgi:hypothetical protein
MAFQTQDIPQPPSEKRVNISLHEAHDHDLKALKLMAQQCFSCHNADMTGGSQSRLGPPMFMVRRHYYKEGFSKVDFIHSIVSFVKNPREEKSRMKGAIKNSGLTMRYLGISVGMAIALGFSALFGTRIPLLYEGRLLASLAEKPLVIPGVLLCYIGIVIAGLAGARKEKELSKEQKQASVKEANFPLGILVATVSGIMRACFAFGLAAGTEVADAALAQGTPTLWQSNPVLILVMLGGFVTNFLWCLGLNIKNRSFYDYTKVQPLTKNYLLAGTAGIVWYHQFMF